MAKRPVFIPQGEVPFARAIETEFSWNGGFAPSQKQKNIRALHGAFLAAHPDARVLEISSVHLADFPANPCRKTARPSAPLPWRNMSPLWGGPSRWRTCFRPGRCLRAAAAARFVSLHRLGLLKKPFSFEDFLRRMGE